MNFIAVIILLALIFDFCLHLLADMVNLKHLSPVLPKTFRDTYDTERYARSQQYLKTNTRFDWMVSITNLLTLLCFWFLGGFNLLDQFVRGFGKGPVLTGIFFIAILLVFRSVLNLPFTIYHTFVIEEKFGFNKTTLKTFILDRFKGILLGIVIGIPLLAGILAFFEHAGGNAWWYCWLLVAVFGLVIQYVGPTWIMPLFNKFSPLEEGELRQALFSFAGKVRFPLKKIFLMDGSRRSSKSNAFFTGFGRNKRIVLFDTLVDKTTTDELVAILGHEMGHYKLRHIWMNTVIGILHSGVLFFLLSLFISLPALFDAFYMDSVSVYGGVIFFGMLYSPVEFFMGLLLQARSRRNEYQADRFAVENTGNPEAMAGALKKLSAQNLSNLTPHPFFVALNYSHPPVLKRIEAFLGEYKPSQKKDRAD